MHQAAAELQERLRLVAILAVLPLTVDARALPSPGVFQLQRREGQAIDKEHDVDLFAWVGARVGHLAGATEDIGGEVLLNQRAATRERWWVHELQVSIVDCQPLFQQVQDAVLFCQAVEAFEHFALPIVAAFLQLVEFVLLGGAQELPEKARVDGEATIKIAGVANLITIALVDR